MKKRTLFFVNNSQEESQKEISQDKSLKSVASQKYSKFTPQSFKLSMKFNPLFAFFDIQQPKQQRYFTLKGLQQQKVTKSYMKNFGLQKRAMSSKEEEYWNLKHTYDFRNNHTEESIDSHLQGKKLRKLSFISKNDTERIKISPKQKQVHLGDGLKLASNMLGSPTNLQHSKSCRPPPLQSQIEEHVQNTQMSIAMRDFQQQLYNMKLKMRNLINQLRTQAQQLFKIGTLSKNYTEVLDSTVKKMNKMFNQIRQKLLSFKKSLGSPKAKSKSNDIERSEFAYESKSGETLHIKIPTINMPNNPNQQFLNLTSYQPPSAPFTQRKKRKANYNEQMHQSATFGIELENINSLPHHESQSSILDDDKTLISKEAYQKTENLNIEDSNRFRLNLNNLGNQYSNSIKWSRNSNRKKQKSRNPSIDEKMKGFENAMSRIKTIMTNKQK